MIDIEEMDRRRRENLATWGPDCRRCHDPEFRIDGYCSIECRDAVHDEAELAAVTAERDRFRDIAERNNGADAIGYYDMWQEALAERDRYKSVVGWMFDRAVNFCRDYTETDPVRVHVSGPGVRRIEELARDHTEDEFQALKARLKAEIIEDYGRLAT